jgi:RimJ/RimL family protein N-acetyltransferase
VRNRLFGLTALPETLESRYGSGPIKYCKFIYYSFLCMNKFIVLRALKNEFDESTQQDARHECLEIPHDALSQYRNGKHLPREYYIDRNDCSMRCFGVTMDQTPCHIHWVHSAGVAGRFLILGDDEAEISHIVTLPEYRGQGLCSQAVRQTLAQLFREGRERVYSVVHSENAASLKALARAGMARLRDVHTLGPFNRRIRPGADGDGRRT